MQTFDDLVFKYRDDMKCLDRKYGPSHQAELTFDNGYGVSVLLGGAFYSNGRDTHEVGIIKDGQLDYTTHITNDVLSNLTADEVTEIMVQIQQL